VSPIFLPRISAFIAHLLIVAVRVQVSKHDAAESYQRSLTLFVREQTPELDERHRPDNGRARGGAMVAMRRDMGHLRANLGCGLQSIPPAESGRLARLSVCLRISVKTK
jgi:hypothetical protein